MEARRYAARLSSRLADYMVSARSVHAEGASVEELAVKQGLEAAVLEKWVLYLKPSRDIRPHLERWFESPVSAVKDVAQQYQIQFDATAKKWTKCFSSRRTVSS